MDLRSGYPFWFIKDGLPFNYPKLENDLSTDVVVLGAGISGALTAALLSEAGIPCIVLDGRTAGLGSTCASTSLLQYEIDTPLSKLQHLVGRFNAIKAYTLCVKAIHDLGHYSRRIGFEGFCLRPSLYFTTLKKDLAFLEQEHIIRKEAGIDVRLLDEDDIRSDYGMNALGAIESSCGAELDAYLFTHFLLQYCIRSGNRVYDRSRVADIEYKKRSCVLHLEANTRVKCRKLVIATGYESQKYLPAPVMKLHSTYACISEQANSDEVFWNNRAMLWSTGDPYLYMRTTDDNRILVGGRDEDFYSAAKRDKLIRSKSRQLAADFSKLFPGISFLPEFSWAGTFASTHDGLPFIGSCPGLNHTLFALGFGGNGIVFSMIAAQQIRDILKGKKPDSDELFSFERKI